MRGRLLLTIATVLGALAPAAAAQAAAAPAPPALRQLVTAIGGNAADAGSSRYGDLRKLDSHVQQLAADQLGGTANPSLATGGLSLSGGRVLVDVYVHGDLAAAAGELRAQGMDVTATSSHAPGRIVEGWLPIGSAVGAAGLDATRAVVPVAGFGLDTGGTLSQGDAAHHGPQARALGPTGAGVPVGIISDSIDRVGGGVAGSQGTGDLPASVQVLQDGSPSATDEGRAMAEIVYDEAPGIPSILFSTGSGGIATKAASIDALVAHGAKVIADDTFYIGEPFFQDGVVAQAVDRAHAAGVAYVSSAGNRARQSWEGTFTPAADGVSNNFNPGGAQDTVQTIGTVGAGGSRFLELQWDEPWGGASSAFQIDVYSDGSLLGSVSSAAGVPSAFFNYSAGGSSHVLGIAIKRLSGSGTPHLKYIVGGGPTFTIAEHDTSSPAIDPDAASARGALTVAAVQYSQLGLDVPEPFSSRGPVTRLFDTSGNRLATPDVRAKPDLAAADGVSTSVPGFAPFFGTSAAAPSAAGIAALLRSANPGMSLDELSAIMTAPANAIDCLLPGDPDADCGSGFLLADRAVGQALDTTPPLIVATTSPASPDGANGWFHGPVGVSWSLSDAQSPVLGASGCDPQTLSGDGVSTVTCSASSAGGPSSVTLTVKRDGTPPTAPAFRGIAARTYLFGRVPPLRGVSCSASDALSGVSGCTISGYSAAFGRHTLTGRATNGAGLTSSATLTYAVSALSRLVVPHAIGLRALKRSGLSIRLGVAAKGTKLDAVLTVTVKSKGRTRTFVLGRVSKRKAAKGTTTLRLLLTKAGKAHLAGLRRASLQLAVTTKLGSTATTITQAIRGG